MFELLQIGTWLFWVAILIVSCFIFAAEGADRKGNAILAVVLFTLAFGAPILQVLHAFTVTQIFLFLGAYIAIGGLWSLFKWWLHCKRVREEIASLGQATTIPTWQIQKLRDKLTVSQNKSRLTFYIAFWPWSMAWSGMRDFFEGMYNRLRAKYERIAKAGLDELATLETKKPE